MGYLDQIRQLPHGQRRALVWFLAIVAVAVLGWAWFSFGLGNAGTKAVPEEDQAAGSLISDLSQSVEDWQELNEDLENTGGTAGGWPKFPLETQKQGNLAVTLSRVESDGENVLAYVSIADIRAEPVFLSFGPRTSIWQERQYYDLIRQEQVSASDGAAVLVFPLINPQKSFKITLECKEDTGVSTIFEFAVN